MSLIFQKPPHNYQYKVGISNEIDFELSPAVATGVVVDAPLQNLIIPANVLVQDGQKINVHAFGSVAGATANRTFRARLNGATVIFDSAANAYDNGEGWWSRLMLFRLSSTQLIIYGQALTGISPAAAPGGTIGTRATHLTLAVNPLAQMDIQLFADIPGAGDSLTQLGMYANVQ